MSNEIEILYRNYTDEFFQRENPKTLEEALKLVAELVKEYDIVSLDCRKP